MPQAIYNKIIKAGRKNYYFDIRETESGDRYLNITESRRQKGKERRTDMYTQYHPYKLKNVRMRY